MEEVKEKKVERIPAPKPGAGSAYNHGWDRFKVYFLDLLLVTLIVAVVWIPAGIMRSFEGTESAGAALLKVFALAYMVLLVAPVDYGAAFVFLKAARGEKFEIKDMFLSFENYLNVVLARVLVAAIVGMGIVLLIVPGIIFACKLAFVKYLVMDRKLDPVTAVKESWRMTKGYTGHIFVMGLLSIPIGLAGLILFGMGILLSIIWIRSAFASMYYAVSQAGSEKEAAS